MPPRPRGRARHEWYENDERLRSVAEIGEKLQQIGRLLSERGSFTVGRSNVAPSDPSMFKIRLERRPEGELVLKLEIEWLENDSNPYSSSLGSDITIE